ncbi:MAG: hypothetical protein EBR82_29100 [Caulobacteraceae bacterium]|nr:hypothetical protein [Caulobacteraceae bacterium]
MLYTPLKSFVAKRGGLRLAAHSRTRDRLIEMAVEEWPANCDPDKLFDVLKARMSIRVRKEYGSVLAMFLISVLVNAIAKLVVEWWFSRDSHRVLMLGWRHNATGRQV